MLTAVVCIAAAYGYSRWFYYNVKLTESGGAGGASSTLAELDEMNRQGKWFDIVNSITPVLDAYFKLHPEKFQYTGTDDEITIDGFAKYIRANNPYLCERLRFGWSTILDPWGEPLHFVMVRGDRTYVEARGAKEPVMFTASVPPPVDDNSVEKLGICKNSLKGLDDQRGSRRTLWVLVYR